LILIIDSYSTIPEPENFSCEAFWPFGEIQPSPPKEEIIPHLYI
jgi:hypothetical protein